MWLPGSLDASYAARCHQGFVILMARMKQGALILCVAASIGWVATVLLPGGAAVAAPLRCSDDAVAGFTRGLEMLRRDSAALPARGGFPFGPRGPRVLRDGEAVRDAPSRVGFLLRANDGGGGADGSRVVAVTRLSRVSLHGGRGRLLRTRRQMVTAVLVGRRSEMRLGAFRIGRRPAYYRVEVAIRKGRRNVRRYVEFIRMSRRRTSVVLALSAGVLHPGERAFWRVENRGTTPVIFGVEFGVERWTPSGWVDAGFAPGQFPAVGLYVGAGRAGDCERLRLPADLAAGFYRLVKPVTVGGREQQVVARFRVE